MGEWVSAHSPQAERYRCSYRVNVHSLFRSSFAEQFHWSGRILPAGCPGCANRQNPTEWEFEVCVECSLSVGVLCVFRPGAEQLCLGQWPLWIPREGAVAASSVMFMTATVPSLSHNRFLVPCITKNFNNCWRSQYLNTTVSKRMVFNHLWPAGSSINSAVVINMVWNMFMDTKLRA